MSDDLDERIDDRLGDKIDDFLGPGIPWKWAFLMIAVIAAFAFCFG